VSEAPFSRNTGILFIASLRVVLKRFRDRCNTAVRAQTEFPRENDAESKAFLQNVPANLRVRIKRLVSGAADTLISIVP
jgi:hypothetical protein